MILGLLLGIFVALVVLAVIGGGRKYVARHQPPEIEPYVERERSLW